MVYYGVFQDFIYNLEALGIADVLLPFLLIFVLAYYALSKAFEDSNRRISIVVSLVLGFAVVIPHVMGTYPAGYDVVEIINNYLPNIGLILVAVIGIMILLGLIGVKIEGNQNQTIKNVAAWVLVIIAIILFLNAVGWFNFGFYIDPETISFVIALIIFGLLVWYITSPDKNPKSGKGGQSHGQGGNP